MCMYVCMYVYMYINSTVTRHAIPIINKFLKGFQIFGRFCVVWGRVPYSEAFTTIINLIHYSNI